MLQTAQKPLSNIQEELLRMYANGISDQTLIELRKVMAKFLFDKARNEADQVWEDKKYSQATIENWLNED